MEKVRPWCGQPSDREQLKNRTELGPSGASNHRLVYPLNCLLTCICVTYYYIIIFKEWTNSTENRHIVWESLKYHSLPHNIGLGVCLLVEVASLVEIYWSSGVNFDPSPSTLCLKKASPTFFISYSNKYCLIFIMFDTYINKRLGSQRIVYFPTSPTYCLCTTLWNLLVFSWKRWC